MCPSFSSLEWRELSKDGVKVNYSVVGWEIYKGIKNLQMLEPKIQLYQYIIMPDHLHLLLRVKERMAQPIGAVIRHFKTRITSDLRKITDNPLLEVFTPDFNDRIIYPHRNLDEIFNYIRSNPYRLAVRQARPEFFRKERCVEVNGRKLQAYGNMFLMRNPFKIALVVHRADSEMDFNRKLEECLYYAGNGGVVVSAFISKREKEIRKAVEQANGRLIVIGNQLLGERQKPPRHDFELCSRGNLLLIAPLDYAEFPLVEHPSRSQCLDMNGLAESLSNLSPDALVV